MVTQNIVRALGVFSNSQELEPAINDLKAAGFPMERVSVIAKDIEQSKSIGNAEVSESIGNQNVDTTGAVGDTLTATTWGSVLAGLSSLAIPGLGALLAAGSLGVALVASVAGVAVGATATQNLVTALANLGVPEDRARVYSDRLQQSYYLLIIEGTEPDIHRAESILRDRGIEYWGVYDAPQVEK